MVGSWSFCFTLLVAIVRCEVYLEEKFSSKDDINEWVQSKHHKDSQGEWEISAGKDPVNDKDFGLQTKTDFRYYGIAKKLDRPFSTEGKTFVLQFTVKYDQSVSCGGAYIKLFGSDLDPTDIHGESPYKLMFGPDICGYSTKKIHVVIPYNGKNHLYKEEVSCPDDLLTHLFTLIINPDNTYKLLVDNEQKKSGSLEDHWDLLPPKKIADPSVSKPSDWVDEPEMDDPNDKKPDDWVEVKTIPDPQAKKPEDWDDEMDGEWEPPKIDNPDYKGDWKPKKIPNPKYKGEWKAPEIDNPEYAPDDKLYLLKDVAYVGFDLWQVSSGSLFDNILLTDDPEYARSQGEEFWKSRYEAEKAAKEKKDAEDAKRAEEERKKMEEEEKKKKEDKEKKEDKAEQTEEEKEKEDQEAKIEPTKTDADHEEL
ncbi:Calreticulin [Fasciola gigantica]|uniref:Calreticulin n=1 Tax=Fasciola gigantica TaxID=46835 RepID=A0A504ZBD5_FASGI|nr:Calreticulin [Fasciola gigantica]